MTNDGQQPPRRISSTEMTAVIPREKLPRPMLHGIAALGLDPDHPETAELVARAEDEFRRAPTLVPCPAGCQTCGCCRGTGMVTTEEANRWRLQQTEARADNQGELA